MQDICLGKQKHGILPFGVRLLILLLKAACNCKQFMQTSWLNLHFLTISLLQNSSLLSQCFGLSDFSVGNGEYKKFSLSKSMSVS